MARPFAEKWPKGPFARLHPTDDGVAPGPFAADRGPECASGRGQRHQRVFQIVKEIVNGLESHTESHQITGHLIAGAGGAGMGHLGRMLNEALHGAEALGQREDAGPRAELDGSVFPTVHGETDHATEGPHLRLGNSVTWVVGKRRMVHLFNCRMAA